MQEYIYSNYTKLVGIGRFIKPSVVVPVMEKANNQSYFCKI
jgi:hypothetical protein